jgi:Flp pilus assembly protein TadG
MDEVMTFTSLVRRDDTGAVAVIVAICALLLLGVAALAVDIGREYEVRRQAQSGADLAALAGALYLPRQPGLACQAALQSLKDNTPSGQAPGDIDDPSACDATTGNTADGQIAVTNDATVITVTTPTKIVRFGLAAALGISQGATGAKAAAAIRSVGDVLPYALAATGGSAGGIKCIKVGQPPKTCTGPSDGNFNFLIFPRSDGSNSPWIDRNTALGIEADALPTYFAAAKDYFATHSSADLQCDDPRLLDKSTKPDTVAAQTGAVTLQAPYKSLTPGETCADTETGNKPDDVTAGLITLDKCAGKLANSAATGLAIDNCNIVPDAFGSYLTPGVAAGVDTTNCAAAQFSGSPTLSGSVLDDQRFGIVPEVTTVPTTGSSDYAIIGFLGVYIGQLYDNNSGQPMVSGSNGKVGAFDACVFSLDSIAGGGGSPLSQFLGSGPTVPVLIK